MHILNNGRFGIPAMCTGAMKHCIQKTEKLANMVARHYATESVLYLLASNMDRGIQDYQLEAAIGKVAASTYSTIVSLAENLAFLAGAPLLSTTLKTEVHQQGMAGCLRPSDYGLRETIKWPLQENAWWVCDEAIQLHGGMGFMKDCGLERVMRDLRIFRIFEGANDVLRVFIALTGAQHAGRHLQQVAKEIKSGGIGTLFGQVVKRATGGNTGANFSTHVEPALTESSLEACATVSKNYWKDRENLLMKYKKDIVNRQYELVRVADAAIDIYCMIATISRCTHSCKKNAASAAHEKEIASYFCSIASRRTMQNLKEAAKGNEHDVKLITSIATAVCKNGGLPQQHPVDV
ncbi:acyl-CoA dehydrogenase protein [Cooperia oncophora]